MPNRRHFTTVKQSKRWSDPPQDYQDRQCTYNVILRRVYESTVDVEKQKYYIFLCGCTGTGVCLRACSLNFPARNAPPFCHLWPLWLHKNFPHYLINDTIFGKRLLNIKCVFWFFLQLLFETLLILRIIQRDIVIHVKTASRKVTDILVGF